MNSLKNTYSNELIRRKNIHDALHSNLITRKQWLELENSVSFNISYYTSTIYIYLNDMMKNNVDNPFIKNYSEDINQIGKQYSIK